MGNNSCAVYSQPSSHSYTVYARMYKIKINNTLIKTPSYEQVKEKKGKHSSRMKRVLLDHCKKIIFWSAALLLTAFFIQQVSENEFVETTFHYESFSWYNVQKNIMIIQHTFHRGLWLRKRLIFQHSLSVRHMVLDTNWMCLW